MRLGGALAVVAALVAWFFAFGPASGEHGLVVGSLHDLGASEQASGVSSCEVCHVPHDASGEALWADGDPHPDGDVSASSSALCYSCHDGTVTSGSGYVFDSNQEQHPMAPAKTGEGCGICHDPHVPDYGSFLLFPSGANLCRSCHAGGGAGDHPVNVEASNSEYAPDDPWRDPGEGDISGTELFGPEGTGPGSQIKCLSCHAPHGAAPGTKLLSMAYEDTSGLASLCGNCHY